jgi:ubiquinone/menaquinone biosynthesis C-methylase UbiE
MANHPIFAALYDRLLAGAEQAGLAASRARLLAAAAGRTLELGAGTGANLEHYPAAVSEAVLTEPDPHMAQRMRRRLAAEPPRFPVELHEVGAERLPFADASFDTVVSTLVLCTVDDPRAAAAEIARVLRPGGTLLVLEHVRDPDSHRVARWQDRLERPWTWVAGGCHPNRDTSAILAAAGFEVSGLGPGELPRMGPLIRPAILGSARAPAG